MTTADRRTPCAPLFSNRTAIRSAARAAAILLPLASALADDPPLSGPGLNYSGGGGAPIRADDHAPIGVMGDHLHKKGEWMLSYRYMYMDMAGNRIGTDNVSPQEIASTIPNTYPQMTPMGIATPPFLRVVPTQMTMQMHMLGAMYAPTNNVTLMAMVPILDKDMDHLTFQAPNPSMGILGNNTNIIGAFSTSSEGVGDIKLSGLFRLYDDATNHVHLNLGISAPTGSITKRGNVFTPFGTITNLRLPYAMQLGTGTWDLLPGLTYRGRIGDLSWGAQYMAEVRLEDENDEGYAWGDRHTVTGWFAYEWAPWISTSVRASYSSQAQISGMDAQITAPVQTAYPEYYGGEKVELFGGINLVGQSGWMRGHRLALEVGAPVYQDLNGPQMETDWTLMVGWQKAF